MWDVILLKLISTFLWYHSIKSSHLWLLGIGWTSFWENAKPQNGCFSLSAGNTNSISASLYYSGQTRWCHPKVLQKGIALFQSVCVCVFFSGCSNSINLNYHTSWVLLLEYMEVSPTNRMDHVITDLLEICKIDRQAVFEANPQLLEPSKRPWFPWLQLYFQFLGFYCSVNNGKSSCSVGDAFPTGPWFHHVSLLECDFAC